MVVLAKFIKEVEIEIDDDKYGDLLDLSEKWPKEEESYEKAKELWNEVSSKACPEEKGNNISIIKDKKESKMSGLIEIKYKGKTIIER